MLAKRKRKRLNPVKVTSDVAGSPAKQPRPFNEDLTPDEKPALPTTQLQSTTQQSSTNGKPEPQVKTENGKTADSVATIGGVAVWSSPDLMRVNNSTAALGSSQTVCTNIFLHNFENTCTIRPPVEVASGLKPGK